jgi:hypothetical protein
MFIFIFLITFILEFLWTFWNVLECFDFFDFLL